METSNWYILVVALGTGIAVVLGQFLLEWLTKKSAPLLGEECVDSDRPPTLRGIGRAFLFILKICAIFGVFYAIAWMIEFF
jgi:hypothetical protein